MISSTLRDSDSPLPSENGGASPAAELPLEGAALDLDGAGRAEDRFHVAIIMDGNGRWALRRGRPRREGHRAGAEAVRRVVEAAPELGITTLTLYAFSSDNWRRPLHEVNEIMCLFQRHLRSERPRCIENGVRVSVLGRRDRLPAGLSREIEIVQSRTRFGARLHLRLAIDYSSRDALLRAAVELGSRPTPTRQAFEEALLRASNAPRGTRNVDLLVRTGGEKRLSDFLLWECAYAELLFTDRLWPDFSGDDLATAVLEFRGRERRFGGLPGLNGDRSSTSAPGVVS